jgi:hypothetical protein
MNLIVIYEKDHDDNEQIVIGVADSVKNAEIIIDDYYGKGKYTEVSFNDIRDSGLEYSKVIEIHGYEIDGYERQSFKCTLTLQWFTLNES